MNAITERSFNKLEDQRNLILTSVGDLPAQKYTFRPMNKWGLSELLTHLITSEQLSVNYMKKKSLGIEMAGDSGIVESFKMGLLKVSQRLPLKYKAPEIILQSTPSPYSLEAATFHWQHTRIDLRTLAENIPDKYIKKKIFKHPIAGRFDLVQAMDFFYEHINHHWPQIKRLL